MGGEIYRETPELLARFERRDRRAWMVFLFLCMGVAVAFGVWLKRPRALAADDLQGLEDTLRLEVHVESYESDYRRNQSGSYECVSTRTDGSMSMRGTGLFSDYNHAESISETTDPSKDAKMHELLQLVRKPDGKLVLVTDIYDKEFEELLGKEGSRLVVEGEAQFIQGSWDTYQRGEQCEVVYTDEGMAAVTEKFMRLIDLIARSIVDTLADRLPGRNLAVSPVEVRIPNTPLIVSGDRASYRETEPTRVVILWALVPDGFRR